MCLRKSGRNASLSCRGCMLSGSLEFMLMLRVCAGVPGRPRTISRVSSLARALGGDVSVNVGRSGGSNDDGGGADGSGGRDRGRGEEGRCMKHAMRVCVDVCRCVCMCLSVSQGWTTV
jgi:hypothetical protein